MSETVVDYMPQTSDVNQERLELLKQECPDWFTEEGQLDIEEVRKAVDAESVKQSERFDFTWFGKNQAKRQAFTPSNAALKYDEERSVNPEKADGNLIIEGENLEVLKLLLSSYRDKVKCIYIDPPYNKEDDRIYDDSFREGVEKYLEKTKQNENGINLDTHSERSGRYHSSWLNMMYSRLLIARHLLNKQGAIFVSIDDTEVTNLKKVLFEVFGEENFVCSFVWKKRKGGGNDSRFIAVDHEYILCFAKNKSSHKSKWRVPYTSEYLKRYNKEDEKGRFYWDTLSRPGLQNPIKYKIPTPDGGTFKGEWQVSKDTFDRKYKNGDINVSKNDDGSWSVKHKVRQPNGKVFRSLITHVTNSDAANEMEDLFGHKKIFDNPKPSNLISKFIQLNTSEDDIVLDFFAGSGSTAQSILESNEANLQFILIQIPELINDESEAGIVALDYGYKKISDITIERNKRVIQGYGDDPKPIDAGFKVYKLAKSNFPRIDFTPDPEKSEEENVEALKEYINEKESSMQTMFNEEDIVDEVLLKNGFMLDYSLEQQEQFKENNVYLAKDSQRKALVCLDGELHEKTVEHFNGNDGLKFICLERALDTTKKWNLKHYLGDKLYAM